MSDIQELLLNRLEQSIARSTQFQSDRDALRKILKEAIVWVEDTQDLTNYRLEWSEGGGCVLSRSDHLAWVGAARRLVYRLEAEEVHGNGA